MTTLHLSDLHALISGLLALAAGTYLSRRIRLLDRLTVPPPVVGGLLAAAVVAGLRSWGGIEVHFASALSDLLLLVFFATVGLSARLAELRSGGRPLAILCGVTVFLLLAQNIVGVAVAMLFGAHPFFGLLAGSISFVGGPGTAAAWGKEAQSMGLVHAPEVAVAAATLAVIAGALAAGPAGGWLARRSSQAGTREEAAAPWVSANGAGEKAEAPPIAVVMRTLLLVLGAVAAGQALNAWAHGTGVVLPGFLAALLCGAMITNGGALIGARLAAEPVERLGEMALQAFLAMYLMGLKIWTLGAVIGPLAINVVLQVVVSILIARWVLYRALGSDYDAAVTAGGFFGFGVSSMPVAFATMEQVSARYGPSPKAFLLITLAGSFFVDIANAVVVQALLRLPLFR